MGPRSCDARICCENSILVSQYTCENIHFEPESTGVRITKRAYSFIRQKSLNNFSSQEPRAASSYNLSSLFQPPNGAYVDVRRRIQDHLLLCEKNATSVRDLRTPAGKPIRATREQWTTGHMATLKT